MKPHPTFHFLGVTTGRSSINKIFPLWAHEMGRPGVVLQGVDLKIHAPPADYRAAVAEIKHDPLSLGGLVTTHKIDLYDAARDLFDEFDPFARLCGEVSCISKQNGRLVGHAKEPITAETSLDAIIGPQYFGRTGGNVLCFGAGGSAAATLLALINKPDSADRPRRFIIINRSQPRLDRLRVMMDTRTTDIELVCIRNEDPIQNDQLMGGLPDRSIVINATGMGKDTPGSPITNHGVFPRDGVAWEFNYRGELDFLRQARAQQEKQNLMVEDGWAFFLHGWSQVMAEVFHVPLTPDLFQRLRQIAEAMR